MDQRFPTLCKHLTRHGVNVSSMALQWFLCMFVNSLPLESCFRVWDVLFSELSSSVLFRCGLALVDIYAQASKFRVNCRHRCSHSHKRSRHRRVAVYARLDWLAAGACTSYVGHGLPELKFSQAQPRKENLMFVAYLMS